MANVWELGDVNNENLKNALNEAMVIIDKAFTTIDQKLDHHHRNISEKEILDQQKNINLASIAVHELYCKNYSVGGLDCLHLITKSLYEKYECVLKKRITERVIPFLEKKRNDKLLLKEVVEQWSLFGIYRSNLEKIFKPVEELGYISVYYKNRNYRLWTLLQLSKNCFCQMVWEDFHYEIDEGLTEMINSGAFNKEVGGNCIDPEILKFSFFYYEMEFVAVSVPNLKRTYNLLKDYNIRP
ncbi:uncharacterized protein LOC133035104 [Cannabis sativa]|uniref:uncharacterized protein LOC133035104 n=1 Tax=Cannabis sativa TaxID=3483 RepID=UPI0029C9C3BB|nr:uncharacterized protein LOC133035104 [Cannabis sativa]